MLSAKTCIHTFSILILLHTISSCTTKKSTAKNNSQKMIARMEVKEPIEGVCDQQNVLVLMSFFGAYQVEAKSPMTKAQITQELQEKVDFLKNNSDYNDKGMVNLIINCKGDLVQCKIDNKTKNPELDNQIVAVFSGLKKWTPGTYSGKPVDSVLLYSFVIENGKIKLN